MRALDIRNRSRSRGVTLVELMVAMVVLLLIGIAAVGSATFFTAMQRQSIGASSAQGDASTAMSAVKHEAALAGLGFYSEGAVLCSRTNLSAGAQAHYSDQPMLPLSLTAMPSGGVVVNSLYAGTLVSTAPAQTQADTTLSAGTVALSSYLPVSAGQAVLVAPPVGVDRPCTVRTVTAVAQATEVLPQTLTFGSAGSLNQTAFADVAYPGNSRVSLLGQLQWSRFRMEGTDLLMERPLQGAQAVVARNVMAFRAQYGVGDGMTTTLRSWEDPTGGWAALTPATMQRVVAVRIGVLVRSTQRDKPDAQGGCSATTEAPMLLEEPVELSGDWRCYRYRASSIVVPLRNVVLGAAT